MTKVMLLATGSVTASMLPYAIGRLRAQRPELEVRTGLTVSAQTFVTPRSLALLTGHAPVIDRWNTAPDAVAADHVEIESWPDVFVVYPATAHLIARLSLGLCDTPFLVALSATRKPIGLSPGVPPGMMENPAFVRHRAALAEWPNVVVAPTHPGRSLSNGKPVEDGSAGPLTEIVDLLIERYVDAERALSGLELSWSERQP
jgi:phosphopantothenoylcysteine decarboxylase/phosphopantothenate--cysteine ligase